MNYRSFSTEDGTLADPTRISLSPTTQQAFPLPTRE